jgi:hypothetical protein
VAAFPPIFASLDELLATETLCTLLDLPAEIPWQILRTPIGGGLSGAHLERVTLTDGDRLVSAILKQNDPRHNWLMRASGDTLGREVQFTQSPLWEALPENILVPVLGIVPGADGAGALLMLDLTPIIYPASMSYEPADEGLVMRIVDHLARMHAAYWEHPALATLPWLATAEDAFFTLTIERLVKAAALETTDEDTYGDQALRMWPYLWRFISPEDEATVRAVLSKPERLLAAMTQIPLTLAHGDTWLANMGGISSSAHLQAGQMLPPDLPGMLARPERLVLLDWALATAGAATFDTLWLAHTWHTIDPLWTLELYRQALLRHGVTAAADDETWNLLVDLGWVRTFLMGAEWMVRDVRGAQAETGTEDTLSRDRLNSWCRRAVEICRRRGWA